MKLIKPSYEIIEPTGYTLEDILKHIEVVGRTCYKSEDKIADDSYKKFVEMLINREHGAMLEHGTAYLHICNHYWEDVQKYIDNKYSNVNYELYGTYDSNCNGEDFDAYITANYRTIIENGWIDDLQYMCEPTKYHEKRVSVKFTCDRGVSHEYVRNRGEDGNAFAQESTRYCNYLKEKFGLSVTYCEPIWLKEEEREEFEADMRINEATYFKWLEKGWIAQQARGFLNHFLKTELIITGAVSNWKHFFSLRDDIAAHPSARELAAPLHQEFINRGWV